MKFFVPHTNDIQGQEQLCRLIRGNIESQVNKTDSRRIHRVEFRHGGSVLCAEVGQPAPPSGDDVFAIFLAADNSALYICTPSRGMFNDRPITVPRTDIVSIEDFDGP